MLSVALALSSAVVAHAAGLKFEHVMNIGSEGFGEGQFKYVEDFAFSKDGHLLVTDASHAWVQVFDKTSGKFLARFGGLGDDDHHLDKPEGIAVTGRQCIRRGLQHRLHQEIRRLLQMAHELQRIRLRQRSEHEVGVHGYP
jgi:hypothetical protein